MERTKTKAGVAQGGTPLQGCQVNPVSLTINDEVGFVFEGEISEIAVFVPERVITKIGGSWSIDHIAFFATGWAEKSMRFSDAGEMFDRVFPMEDRPITSATDPRLVALLERLNNVYEVSVA